MLTPQLIPNSILVTELIQGSAIVKVRLGRIKIYLKKEKKPLKEELGILKTESECCLIFTLFIRACLGFCSNVCYLSNSNLAFVEYNVSVIRI